MKFNPRKTLILPLVIAAFLGCGRGREQQQNVLKDLLTMEQALVAQQEIPAPSEDAERYGKADGLVRYMHERMVQASSLNREFLALLKETELWTSPTEWKDPQRVKETRRKAERLVAVVDEYTELIDTTLGAKGMEKVRAMKLGSRFDEDYARGLQESSDLVGKEKELLATTKAWGQSMVDLLAIVDEKMASMDGNIPLFGSDEDAQRYRILNDQVSRDRHLLGELARRYVDSYEAYRKTWEDKVQKAIGS